MTDSKKCKKCNQTKPINNFREKVKGKPYHMCKPCDRMHENEVYRLKKLKLGMKCNTCRKIKLKINFRQHKNGSYRNECKPCEKIAQAKYRKNRIALKKTSYKPITENRISVDDLKIDETVATCTCANGTKIDDKGKHHDMYIVDAKKDDTCPHCGYYVTYIRRSIQGKTDAIDYFSGGLRGNNYAIL